MRPAAVVAIDFETFYDKKAGYSLTMMDPYAYTHDPRFDAYLMSVASDTGEEYVGPPEAFDWSGIAGALWIAHNAAFDGMVVNRLVEQGKIPDIKRRWACTADMVAYLCMPRSLKQACRHLLGLEISKAVREEMDGVRFGSLDPERRKALTDYAGDDARLSLRLWTNYGHLWPEVEREISESIRESGWRGVHIDRKAVAEGLAKLKKVELAAARKFPWVKPGDKKAPPAGSRPAFLLHIKDLGLPVPKSVKKDDPLFLEWAAKYKDAYPVIQARLDYASVITHVARLEAMLALADKDDNLRFSLRYAGCHTLRSKSGREGADDEKAETKFNPLNIPKGCLEKGPEYGLTFGVNMRGTLTPRPGHKFMIYDFCQIESRCVQWIAGNHRFLSLVREIGNIYEADAVQSGLWNPKLGPLKKMDERLYASSKERVLGLGFSLGTAKFLATCRRKKVDLGSIPREQWVLDRRVKFLLRNYTELNWDEPKDEYEIGAFLAADKQVRGWREANAPVVRLWATLQNALMEAAKRGVPRHEFILPSGRPKFYYDPKMIATTKVVKDAETGKPENRAELRLYAATVKGERSNAPLHGGVITENVVQSFARDIMFTGAMDVRKEAPQWAFLWDVYDEMIFEVPDCDVEVASRVIPECLCKGTASTWAGMKTLPLEVEGGARERYMK